MLLFKIAFRNVRRQIGGYLIYFITVALTVSLLFSLAGMMFSKTVFNYSMSFKVETIAVCTFLIILLTVISALVLGYGCSFLLRRRKKEFGMYLTLGMKRGNVVAIFIAEMLFTFLFSIAAGLGLGTLVLIYERHLHLGRLHLRGVHTYRSSCRRRVPHHLARGRKLPPP